MSYFDEMDEMMTKMEKNSGLSPEAQKMAEKVAVFIVGLVITGVVVFLFTLLFQVIL